MSAIDLKTVYLNFLFTNLISLIVMGILWIRSRKRFHGTGLLLIDYLLQVFGVFLIFLRGSINDFISIDLSNTMIMAGALFGLLGLESFTGKKGFQIHNYLLIPLFLIIHYYFTFVHPNLDARNLNSSITLLIISGQCAWLLLKRIDPAMRGITIHTGIVFLLYSLFNIVRIIKFFIFKDSQNDYFKADDFERLVVMTYQLLFIFLTFAITLMINRLLTREIAIQEEKYSKAFQSVPFGIILSRFSDGRLIEVNEGFQTITNYQPGEVLGKTTLEIDLYSNPSDRQFLIDNILRQNKLKYFETKFRKKGGDIFIGTISSELITIDYEKYLISVIIDISERNAAQEKITKANRLFALISQVNQAIVHDKTREKLFSDICNIAIKFGEFKMAWIGLVDEITNDVNPVAFCGAEEGYLSTITKISVSNIPEGQGPTGTAIRENRYQVCNDIINTSSMSTWKDLAEKHGYYSSIAFPIHLLNKPIGALTIYSGQKNYFNEEEIKLFEEISLNISYALDTLEMEKDNQKTVALLAENENKLRSLFNSTSEAIFIHDPYSGKIIDCNEVSCLMYGYTKEELLNQSVDMISFYDDNFNHEKVKSLFEEIHKIGEITFEWKAKKKNGELFWCEVSLKMATVSDNSTVIAVVRNIEERKKLEKSIVESEERHRLMFETSQEAIVIIKDSHLAYFNPKLLDLTGYDSIEAKQMNFIEFIHPDDRNIVENNHNNRFSGKEFESRYQFRVLRKNGSIRWVTLSGSILSWQGEPAGFYFLTDISDLKLAEHMANERMKELNAFYRLGELIEDRHLSLIELYQSFINELPSSWQYPEIACAKLTINDQTFQTHNYKENCIWKLIAQVFINEKPSGEIEIGYLEERPKSDEGPFMKEERYLINGIAERLGHIIERKQAEDKLKASEEKYRFLTENASDVIWILDLKNQNFIYISPAVEHLLGFTVEEALKMSMQQSMTPESYSKVYKAIQENLPQYLAYPEKQANYIMELQQTRKDGTIIWVEVSSRLRINQNGEPELIGISRDISERKKLEAEIIDNQIRLQELVATKDKFFSIIAHDLRSPFTTLMGFTEIMSDEDSKFSIDEYKQYSKAIYKTTTSTYGLLENLLEWSGIQRGKVNYNPKKINLIDFLKDIDDSTLEMARKKSIGLLIDTPVDTVFFADYDMLNSTMRNLVTNAIKFTKEGGTIKINGNKTNSGDILFSIEDTGIGMNQEMIDNLFRIDTNVSRHGTNGEPSTGLGLILCKEFVEKNGGKIWATSEVNKGSTFYFTIKKIQHE